MQSRITARSRCVAAARAQIASAATAALEGAVGRARCLDDLRDAHEHFLHTLTEQFLQTPRVRVPRCRVVTAHWLTRSTIRCTARQLVWLMEPVQHMLRAAIRFAGAAQRCFSFTPTASRSAAPLSAAAAEAAAVAVGAYSEFAASLRYLYDTLVHLAHHTAVPDGGAPAARRPRMRHRSTESPAPHRLPVSSQPRRSPWPSAAMRTACRRCCCREPRAHLYIDTLPVTAARHRACACVCVSLASPLLAQLHLLPHTPDGVVQEAV